MFDQVDFLREYTTPRALQGKWFRTTMHVRAHSGRNPTISTACGKNLVSFCGWPFSASLMLVDMHLPLLPLVFLKGDIVRQLVA